MDTDELDGYLGRVELRALTPATVATAPELRRELDRVRRQRFAVVDQELERGLRSAAAPIHDTAGRVIAAANVGALAGRVDRGHPARQAAAAPAGDRGVDRARPRGRPALTRLTPTGGAAARPRAA